jgi:hypothetical protein
MHTDNESQLSTQTQQWDIDEQQAQRDYELELASEAYHRKRLLGDDRIRSEDLDEELIALLRAIDHKDNG